VSYKGYPGADAWLPLSSLKSKKLPKSAAAPKAQAKTKEKAAAPAAAKFDYSGLEKGMRLQVELQGVWYAAEVVTVAKAKAKAKAPVKVSYVGYAGYDEFVGGDRIRSKYVKKTAAEPKKGGAEPKTKASKATPQSGGYDYSGLQKGMRVQCELQGVWYAAEIVTVSTAKAKAKAPVKVSYVGYAGYDEFVGGDRLRSKALGKAAASTKPASTKAAKATAPAAAAVKYDYSGLAKGMRVQVELQGVYYAANVVTVATAKAKAKAPVKVNFAGYTADFDEWVGGDRIRSKALGKSKGTTPAKAPAKEAAKKPAKAGKAAAPAAAKKYDYSGLAKGMRLQVEAAGVWYAADVVTVSTAKAKAKAPVKVHFAGYADGTDEWVGGDRIRSKAITSK